MVAINSVINELMKKNGSFVLWMLLLLMLFSLFHLVDLRSFQKYSRVVRKDFPVMTNAFKYHTSRVTISNVLPFLRQ